MIPELVIDDPDDEEPLTQSIRRNVVQGIVIESGDLDQRKAAVTGMMNLMCSGVPRRGYVAKSQFEVILTLFVCLAWYECESVNTL